MIELFSAGHMLWIGISFALIIGGYIACRALRPSLDRMLRVCLGVGVASEAVKVFSVTNILPMVEPEILLDGASAALTYAATGEYTPYMEMAHLPIELCSLMIVFIASALLIKNDIWRERLLSLMYVTGLIGGTLGILLAYITADYTSVLEYFSSPRVWQYFLYHAMVVTLGLYLGFGRERRALPGKLKVTLGLLVAIDIPTFYLNSVFSQPVYTNGKPTGIVYRANFFSSYVNPLGIALTQKWQWLVYLAIRLCVAVGVIALLLRLSDAVGEK